MIYILDTADIKEIERLFDLYPIDGVTTNPSIISKEKRDFIPLLKDIRSVIGSDAMLHVQALGTDSDGIVKEAEYLNETIGGNLYIKIPVIPQGIKAIKTLKKQGIKTTATAIFTPQQALIAAKAGADFAAPYVNRLDNILSDGVNVVREILLLYKNYNITAKVLAASFKNAEQVHRVSLYGCHAVTVNPEIMDLLVRHPLTDASVAKFIGDWDSVYGSGKTTLDVK